MTYFSSEFNAFFKDLAPNNHKDWFHANKKRYERTVKEPFDLFLADLILNIRDKYDPSLTVDIKQVKFRINRDIRFTRDKSPYKMHMSAVISNGGRKDTQLPGLYLQLGVGEIAIGGGIYQPDKINLLKIRQHISRNLVQFERLLQDHQFQQYYPTGMRGQANKRIPKAFKHVQEKQPLIANKQFYYIAEYDDESLLSKPDFMDWVLRHYEAAIPITDFLKSAIKI